jgi:hypothetical protein
MTEPGTDFTPVGEVLAEEFCAFNHPSAFWMPIFLGTYVSFGTYRKKGVFIVNFVWKIPYKKHLVQQP